MSKWNRFIVMNCALALMATQALAGGKDGPKPGPGNPGKAISWGELQDRCAHPKSYDNQLAPQNIRVQCSDSRLTWVAGAPGEVPLPGYRTVTSAVFAEKYFVDSQQADIPTKGKVGSCHRFKEVQETVTVEMPLSCDQILGIKGDLADYCASILDGAKGSNPKLVEQHETGRMHSTCGDSGVDNGKPGHK